MITSPIEFALPGTSGKLFIRARPSGIRHTLAEMIVNFLSFLIGGGARVETRKLWLVDESNLVRRKMGRPIKANGA